jgi:hypothetical protein
MNTINGNFIEKSIPNTKNATIDINIGGVDATMTVEKFAATLPAALPYKVYTALLTQTGINDPVANVLYNTIGTVTVSRTGAGVYNISCPDFNFFTLNKTAICAVPTNTNIYRYTIRPTNPTTVELVTFNSANPPSIDDLLSNTMVEIRVYN